VSAGSLDLSVVIPCRDAARHLPQLLAALADERPGVPWEVVVVDNGSRDGTRALAERWAGRLPVRVVDASERPGAWYARNAGAAAARGDHLLFLDSDDLITPGYLAAMRAGLEGDQLVAARLDSRTLNEGWSADSRPEAVVDGLFDHFDFLPYAPTCTLGVRRSAFERLGGFAPVPFAEDVDFSWRAQLAGLVLRPVPEAVVRYRYRQGLRALVGQARRYGAAQALLHRRYRDAGMPGRSWAQSLRGWKGVLRQLVHARNRADLAAALFLIGVYAGRLEGSARWWVRYP
jgi:glycosyltransferase involved in cell wall biosynthesis